MKRPSDLPSGHRKIIGYHGALSDYKINAELFWDVINLNPDWDFVIIGDEREGQSNSTLKI